MARGLTLVVDAQGYQRRSGGGDAVFVLRAALSCTGLNFDQRAESLSWRTSVRGDTARWRVLVNANAADGLGCVFSVYDLVVPAGSRAAVAEHLTRENYLLRVSHFEMDLSDGEVRFAWVLDMPFCLLVPASRERVVHWSCAAKEHFGGVESVACQGVTAEAAFPESGRSIATDAGSSLRNVGVALAERRRPAPWSGPQ